MAITTVNGIVAGTLPLTAIAKAASGTLVAGRPHSFFFIGGVPGAAAAPTPGINGAALTSYDGQIPVPAASGNTYLADFTAAISAQTGIIVLADRLWHNSGINITSTSPQALTSVAFPARDRNGSTNGEGVYLGVEVSTATGAGTPTITVSYTNSDGTSGRTATNINATVASSIAGTFYPLSLQDGDKGVRSIQSITLSATWTSGTIHLVAYRPIETLAQAATGVPQKSDAIAGGFKRIYDQSVPFVYIVPQTTTTSLLTGSVTFAQG